MSQPQICSHTPLPWEGKPHITDETTRCNCTTWGEETYMGGVLSVEVNNGIKLISEGGNDAPPFEEAKANAIFVDRAIHSFYPFIESLSDILSRFRSCIAQGNGEIEGDKEAIACAEAILAEVKGGVI